MANASGNCGNPRDGPPARYRDRIEGRAETSETHFSGPRPVRKYSWGCHWEEKWHDRRPVRQLVGKKIPNRFNAGKPQTPGNGAYLFRPSVSQSSDLDAQVGMFEIE